MSVSVMSPANAVGAVSPATAGGYLALLQEDDLQLRSYALTKLLECVDLLWHQVAEALPDLEAMAEDVEDAETKLPLELRQTAAAVASRVFFHLEEPTQALRLALDAGEKHFDPMQESPYVQRLVAAALDVFCAAARKKEMEETDREESGISVEQLQPMIYRLLESSCQSGRFQDAIGIALEAREVDKLREILNHPAAKDNNLPLLKYALDASVTVVTSKAFRMQALQIIVDCLQKQFLQSQDAAYDLVRVYQMLGQANPVAKVLQTLLKSEQENDVLLAYQLCFDLMDSGDQAFIKAVSKDLFTSVTTTTATESTTESDSPAMAQAKRVLVEGFPSQLVLSFLHKESRADRLIMENLKKALEERSSGSRNSILHNAAVMTHSYLYAGTTNDSFLRDFLDWMKKASNWAKFSATASLGVIHAMHISEAMHLLQPYLPPNPSDGDAATAVSPLGGYAEGGSLYALGLIHGSHVGSSAEKRQETTDFLRSHLRVSHANEVISHGAALGLGLTAMGSCDLAIVNELKEVLDTDSAVAGEAAGVAIGLVLVGTGAGNMQAGLSSSQEEIAELVVELKNYARETQHEKIIRGIVLGLALMSYGQEENADALIEELRSDRDPVMRYGAMYTLSLAYCGTGSNKAIRILLHTAVSDVSDDVRMAAVIGLAFILFKTPNRVPQLVKLLLESFNPHVRYGSCMAIGIAMAGTGDSESINMLEPMLDDMTDYVRQGALMGTAMIYMQQSDSCNGRKIRSFREKIATIVTEKHHATLTKMGAIMATGILDAGGRNCSMNLGSRNGFIKMSSAVGLALWLQHWHWYPMMHMFSLVLTPTCTIGLNKDFKYPKRFEIICNSKPSVFAYPKKLEGKKEEKKKRVETVTLSTTAKENARLARKRAKNSTDMDKEDEVKAKEGDDATTDKVEPMDIDKPDEVEKKPKKKREPEPTMFRVGNPARITSAQSKVCEFDFEQRYHPIRPSEKPIGVIILTDSTPNEEEELGTVKSPSLEPEGELAPPEPFVWTPEPVTLNAKISDDVEAVPANSE